MSTKSGNINQIPYKRGIESFITCDLWILFTGFWRDTGIWNDNCFWND